MQPNLENFISHTSFCSAFPSDRSGAEGHGITRREYYAATLLPEIYRNGVEPETAAVIAFEIADAMILHIAKEKFEHWQKHNQEIDVEE